MATATAALASSCLVLTVFARQSAVPKSSKAGRVGLITSDERQFDSYDGPGDALLVLPGGVIIRKQPGIPLVRRSAESGQGDRTSPGPGLLDEATIARAVADTAEAARVAWPELDLASRPVVVATLRGTLCFGLARIVAESAFPHARIESRQLPWRDSQFSYCWLGVAIDPSRLYVFARPDSDGVEQRLREVSRLAGSGILVLDARRQSALPVEELRRVLMHESVHVFLQGEVLFQEPTFIDPTVPRYSGRTALERLYNENAEFRVRVERERCVGLQLAEAIDRRDGPKAVGSLLALMLSVQRARCREFGCLEAERFWYWIEGVPRYLETREAWTQGTGAEVADHLRGGCGDLSPRLLHFYALDLGAVQWHALDVLDPSGTWRKSAAFTTGSLNAINAQVERLARPWAQL